MAFGKKNSVDVTIQGKDETKGAFSSVQKEMDTLGGKARALLNPLNLLKTGLASLAAVSLGAFFKKAVEAATSSEASWVRVATAVRNLGKSSADARPELDKLFATIQKTTRFSDDDASDAFANLVRISGDYAGSIKNLSLATDLAAARQMDLGAASDLVARAMIGDTSMLKRYGIVVREGEDAIAAMRAQLHGFAENDGKTFEGRLAQIANAFDNVMEAIGRAITGGTGTGDGMSAFADALNRFASWIDENSADIKAFVDQIVRLAIGAGEAAGAMLTLTGRLEKFFAVKVGGGKDAAWWQLSQRGVRGLLGLSDPNAPTPTLSATLPPMVVSTPETVAPRKMTPAEKKAAEQAAKEAAGRDADFAKLVRRYGYGQDSALRPLVGQTPTAGAPLPSVGGIVPSVDVGTPTTQTFGESFKAGVGDALESVKGLNTELASTSEILGNLAGGAIAQFTSSWTDGIAEVIAGHESLGQAIVKAGRKAIGAVLQAEAQATLLKAAAAAAEGFTNPIKFLQAAKLFAVGTAEAAAGALFAGGGGGGGGGYSAGGGGYAGGFNSAAQSVQGTGKVTVVMPKGRKTYDWTNPDEIDAFKEFVQQLAGSRQIEFVFEGA